MVNCYHNSNNSMSNSFRKLIWGISVIISIIVFAFNLKDAGIWSTLPLIIHFIGVVLLMGLTAHWYYRTTNDQINGFLCGLKEK